MRRIPVFLLHSCDKIQRFLLGFYRADRRDEPGLFLDDLILAAFKYNFNLFHISFLSSDPGFAAMFRTVSASSESDAF